MGDTRAWARLGLPAFALPPGAQRKANAESAWADAADWSPKIGGTISLLAATPHIGSYFSRADPGDELRGEPLGGPTVVTETSGCCSDLFGSAGTPADNGLSSTDLCWSFDTAGAAAALSTVRTELTELF